MRRSTVLAFAVVFLCALVLYVSTAAPSLTWAHDGADGGDLITAAVTNGVPHPPGYPTYVTIGQVIARVPIGDVAYRFNLFSAVCMALAAGLHGRQPAAADVFHVGRRGRSGYRRESVLCHRADGVGAGDDCRSARAQRLFCRARRLSHRSRSSFAANSFR